MNQDQFLIASLTKAFTVRQNSLGFPCREPLAREPEGYLLAVADGVGGMPAGERASQLAVDSIARYVLTSMPWFLRNGGADEKMAGHFRQALRHCQRQFDREAQVHPLHGGMSTTLTLAFLMGTRLHLLHVGDSRCYRLRGFRMEQLTQDHTLAEELVRHGLVGRREELRLKRSSPMWNVVCGSEAKIRPQILSTDFRAGDTLLLCTDGLTMELPDESIQAILRAEERPETACRRLVEKAKSAGGRDNVTVVVARGTGSPENGHAREEEGAKTAGIPDRAPWVRFWPAWESLRLGA